VGKTPRSPPRVPSFSGDACFFVLLAVLACAAAMQSVPWGRGTGEGIGLSGHKNEFKTGVRIGNWVEEQFGQEAPKNCHQMENFHTAAEEAHVALAKAQSFERNQRVEPNMGVPAKMLFSHGKTHGETFGASMTELHFSEPTSRGARMRATHEPASLTRACPPRRPIASSRSLPLTVTSSPRRRVRR
jgi:hypothetical protein